MKSPQKLKRLVKTFLSCWPINSPLMYAIAQRISDRYNGDNDDDMLTNGELSFLHETLSHAKIVFDIGANVGDWTRFALQHNPTAEYHCFEPNRNAFKKLSDQSFPANVYLNNSGMGASEGHLPFYIYGEGSVLNSLYDRQSSGLQPKRIEEIPIQTLDTYCLATGIEQIDIVKIDVEGHELSVFSKIFLRSS
jgi:FkbM family methyltransferase